MIFEFLLARLVPSRPYLPPTPLPEGLRVVGAAGLGAGRGGRGRGRAGRGGAGGKATRTKAEGAEEEREDRAMALHCADHPKARPFRVPSIIVRLCRDEPCRVPEPAVYRVLPYARLAVDAS